MLATWDDLAPGAPDALTSLCTLTGGVARRRSASTSARSGRCAASSRRWRRVPGVRFSAGTSSFLDLQDWGAGCSEGDEHRGVRRGAARGVRRGVDLRRRSRSPRGRGTASSRAADTGASLVCDAYGGRISRVAPGATAFVHRDVRFSVQIVAYTTFATAHARVRRARARIAPFGNGQAYQNYADLDLRDPLGAYYGANLARLRAISRPRSIRRTACAPRRARG